MALTEFEHDTLTGLNTRLNRDLRSHDSSGGIRVPGFRVLRAYYQGRQRLEQLGLAVPEDLRRFITIVAWPHTYVNALVERLNPQGFLLDGEADDELWEWWQANNLDSEADMLFTDSFVYGRGYLCGGTNADNPSVPLITVESPLQMIHEWNNRTRRITAAARFYSEDPVVVTGFKEQHATLYLPNATIWAMQENGRWIEMDRDTHNRDRVPVCVLVNRPSSDDRYGMSEMSTIIGLTDAAARALTLAQVATEVMGIPQRTAAGMTQADFKDPETNERLTAWESYFGAVWATANPDAKFHQFTAADLANFKTIVNLYAQQVAGITGLPMRFLGQTSDNPVSADAIRADESRLVGTAERKQKSAAVALEEIMRTCRWLKDGKINDADLLMATAWAPASTPSKAQEADAAVKLHAEGLVSRKEVLRALGKSPQQIKTIEDELRAEDLDPIARALLKGIVTDPLATTPPVTQEPTNGNPNAPLSA